MIDWTWSHGAVQGLYLNRETGCLLPNVTIVDPSGAIYFETNELGLKGEVVDPGRKLAVAWGDSIVFGHRWSWPRLLDQLAPGYQFLNGGVEGDFYDHVLERAVAVNRQVKVSLNLVLIGWHPHGRNENVRRDLTAALRDMPNPVLLTIPTALNRRIAAQDLSAYFVEGDIDNGFSFYGGYEYSIALQAEAFDHIVERNAIIRETAAGMGLPLIDLFAAFDTETVPDFRRDFCDIQHPRPSTYPRLAAIVHEGIKSVIAAA